MNPREEKKEDKKFRRIGWWKNPSNPLNLLIL